MYATWRLSEIENFEKSVFMMDQPTFITKEGYAQLKKELEFLKTDKRREIANRIQDAKELGDLSENAEYTEAKEEQSFTEGKILELEYLLKHAEIIGKTSSEIVSVGSTMTLKSEKGKTVTYTIVGSNEANPLKGLISNESPLAKAFLGKKKGEAVKVSVPAGTIEYTIESIG